MINQVQNKEYVSLLMRYLKIKGKYNLYRNRIKYYKINEISLFHYVFDTSLNKKSVISMIREYCGQKKGIWDNLILSWENVVNIYQQKK